MLAVGDASGVPDACRPAAGIFSCFSLQQMPQPAAVLARWAAALAPGGVLAVAYWCALRLLKDVDLGSRVAARWPAATCPRRHAFAINALPSALPSCSKLGCLLGTSRAAAHPGDLLCALPTRPAEGSLCWSCAASAGKLRCCMT